MIRAQFGHVSPAMMAVYSHVRRKALDEAATALEPEPAVRVPPVLPPRTTLVAARATVNEPVPWEVVKMPLATREEKASGYSSLLRHGVETVGWSERRHASPRAAESPQLASVLDCDARLFRCWVWGRWLELGLTAPRVRALVDAQRYGERQPSV